jgi:hypothetical protein
MKLYCDYPHASISMHEDTELRQLLQNVIREKKFTHVLESGTYLGLGSTRFVAEAFPIESPPKLFVTLEASWKNWRQAKTNLARFPFCRPVWGLTVKRDEALKFVYDDEFLKNHQKYEDVFIDDLTDPVAFYANELSGRLGQAGSQPGWREKLDRIFRWAGEDLLRRYLVQFHNQSPLIILDSAGGIGFLEFSTLLKTMGASPYTVLLDDVHHIKHFRSREHIRKDPAFRIIGSDDVHGWLLAQHG